MLLLLSCILLAAWSLYMGWKFYKRADWEEPADPSPDLQGMHKRQAQLMMVEDILQEVHDEGKLSQQALEEFQRFSQSEIDAMQKIETTWKNRRKSPSQLN